MSYRKGRSKDLRFSSKGNNFGRDFSNRDQCKGLRFSSKGNFGLKGNLKERRENI